MARSSPTAELEAVASIECCWRDALSFVAAGDAVAAIAEVDRGGDLLARLGSLESARERLSDPLLPRFAAAVERLNALHKELLAATRKAQESVGEELAAARRGKTALAGYGAKLDASHSCDAVA